MTTGKWVAALSKRFDSSWRSNTFPIQTDGILIIRKWIRHNFRLWLIICGNDDVSHLKNCGGRNLKDKWTQRRSAEDWLGGLAGSTCYVSPFSFASNSPPAQLFSSLLHPRGVKLRGTSAEGRVYRGCSSTSIHKTHTPTFTKTTWTYLTRKCNERIMSFNFPFNFFYFKIFMLPSQSRAINRAEMEIENKKYGRHFIWEVDGFVAFANGPGKPPLESTDRNCRHYTSNFCFFYFPERWEFSIYKPIRNNQITAEQTSNFRWNSIISSTERTDIVPAVRVEQTNVLYL